MGRPEEPGRNGPNREVNQPRSDEATSATETFGIRITGQGFPLTEALGHAPSTAFGFEWLTRDAGGTPFLFVATRGGDPDRVETAFERDPTVWTSELFEEDGNHRLYRAELSAESAELLETCVEHGLPPSSVESARDGWLATLEADEGDLDVLEELCRDWPVSIDRSGGPPSPDPSSRMGR